MIKVSIQQEDIYIPYIGIPKYIKQTLMDIKWESDNNTVIVGDFNMLLTSTDRYSRLNINKENVALYDTLDQIDLFDTFRAFHLKAVEYTCFSSVHKTVLG